MGVASDDRRCEIDTSTRAVAIEMFSTKLSSRPPAGVLVLALIRVERADVRRLSLGRALFGVSVFVQLEHESCRDETRKRFGSRGTLVPRSVAFGRDDESELLGRVVRGMVAHRTA